MAFERVVAFHASEDMRSKLEAIAERELLSVSAVTRRLLDRALRAKPLAAIGDGGEVSPHTESREL
jgi:hypothetical protein